ncbi:DUF429 domain-containing protein [Labilibacter marinus]|uniref:DUF429 domain-containing protein n=1 Tax=Labilibacter marinus TaxID=1477105 RepID=UPI00094F6ABA|nr:DUF429 domain-containing protein [Labilibacter marinus]
MAAYTGIDGCRGGWLLSTLDVDLKLYVQLYTSLESAIKILQTSKVVSIDMPMGLVHENTEQRDCDVSLRKELGSPFSSSVFNVPCHQAVYAHDYPKANRVNKEILGKGLSIQSWNIVPKIKELDKLLRKYPELKQNMFEGHPELCFKYLKGQSLNYKKKTQEGKEERLQLLERNFPHIKKLFESVRSQFLKKDVADDDILDSIVLSINAKEIAKGNYVKFPTTEQRNKDSIVMQVVIGTMKSVF